MAVMDRYRVLEPGRHASHEGVGISAHGRGTEPFESGSVGEQRAQQLPLLGVDEPAVPSLELPYLLEVQQPLHVASFHVQIL
jgi:hypothetical protein